MDRNEVKSKLSNPYKGMGIQPGLDDQGQKVPRLPWELKHLTVPRGKEINRDSTSSGERTWTSYLYPCPCLGLSLDGRTKTWPDTAYVSFVAFGRLHTLFWV